MKAFRESPEGAGLTPDGDPGAKTRPALFRAYMDIVCLDENGKPFSLDPAKDFLAQGADPGGKGDFQGCSEFNPLVRFSKQEESDFQKSSDKSERNAENAPNRVMALDDDPRAANAEELLWDHYRRALERSRRGDAALHLRHQAKARRTAIREGDGLTTVSFDMYLRTSEYSVKLNAEDGAIMGWQFPLLGEGAGSDLSTADALRVAEEAARPPAGAVLAYARYEDIGGAPVFVARWHHVEDGIPIERDFIQVHVNGASGRAFGVFQRWHNVDVTFGER